VIDTWVTKMQNADRRVAFFFTGPYRQLAKVLGRKIVIFMNICGFAIDSCFFIAVCKLPSIAPEHSAY
jgi:hypothetical protein